MIKSGKETYFLITLKRQPFNFILEVLAHEIGHALNFNFRHWENRYRDDVEHHDESWGVWYSKIYKEIFPNQEAARTCMNPSH